MRVGQHILIAMKENGKDVIGFGKIKNIVLVQAAPIVVEINKFWGRNITIQHLKKETKNFTLQEINCPRNAIIELDWHSYYLQIQEGERRAEWEVDLRKDVGKGREKLVGAEIKSDVRRAADLMAETYNMVVMDLNWTHRQNKEYDARLTSRITQGGGKRRLTQKSVRMRREMARKQREKKKKAEAKIPKKSDLVIVSNVRGYKNRKFQMIVAAVGPATLGEGDMIRDLVWDDGNQRIPLTLPASYVGKLSGTQALAFYTKGFPQKIIFDIVQWTRTGNQNFIKKEVPPPALTIRKPMQVELKM